jgi:hypothetical protein
MAIPSNNKWAKNICDALNDFGIPYQNGQWSPDRIGNLEHLIQDVIQHESVFNKLDQRGLVNTGYCPYTGKPISVSSPSYSMFGRKIYFSPEGIQEKKKEEAKNYEEVFGEPMPQKRASGCYIASVIYGSETAPQVITLKNWRDQRLSSHLIGRTFIRTYYFLSPIIAKRLGKHPEVSRFIKQRLLDPLVARLRQSL